MQRNNTYPDVTEVPVWAVCYLDSFISSVKEHVTHCLTALYVKIGVEDTTHVSSDAARCPLTL